MGHFAAGVAITLVGLVLAAGGYSATVRPRPIRLRQQYGGPFGVFLRFLTHPLYTRAVGLVSVVVGGMLVILGVATALFS